MISVKRVTMCAAVLIACVGASAQGNFTKDDECNEYLPEPLLCNTTLGLECVYPLGKPKGTAGECKVPTPFRARIATEEAMMFLHATDFGFVDEDRNVTTLSWLLMTVADLRTDLESTKAELTKTKIDLQIAISQNAKDSSKALSDARGFLKTAIDARVTTNTYNKGLSATRQMAAAALAKAATSLRSSIQNNAQRITSTNAVVRTKVATSQYSSAIGNVNNKVKALQTLTNNDHAALTKMGSPMLVQAQSAGACDGNFFRVLINGKIAGGNAKLLTGFSSGRGWSRGINVMRLDLVRGKVNLKWNFDTCCGSGEISANSENQRLTSLLQNTKVGTVMVFGIIDEGMNQLSDKNRRLLQGFGSKYVMSHITYRESWVMIGVKGAAPGTVPEDHGGDVPKAGCRGGGRATTMISERFSQGALEWMNGKLSALGARQAIPKTQRQVFWKYDGCKNTYCVSRRWSFYKYHDDSALKITYYDNFRCAGNGRSCRWDVMIDRKLCAADSNHDVGPLRYDYYVSGANMNIHQGATIQGYCRLLHNGAILRKGVHSFDVFERSSPQHNHGDPVLGWNWSGQSPGGNGLTKGGTYAQITIEEVF